MKLFAAAFPVTLSRGDGYGVTLQSLRARVAWQQSGELVAKAVIITLFSAMAIRMAGDFRATGHVTGLLLLVSESLVVALTVVRRKAGVVDRSWHARILTGFSTFGPSLVRPVSVAALLPEIVTVPVAVVGIIIVLCGKLSLGRSFGLAPANRGIVSTGLYKFLRHPIYLGYLITHVGFVLANPAPWNLAVLALADVALLFRAVREEGTLTKDEAYRSYTDRVRWRIVPGIF
jgi:protein-S-isoprenylcysteine O-methyltransferase Ste14